MAMRMKTASSATTMASANPRICVGSTLPNAKAPKTVTMMAAALVNYHPLLNTMTTALSPDSLLCFLQSTGHEARIMELATATRDA